MIKLPATHLLTFCVFFMSLIDLKGQTEAKQQGNLIPIIQELEKREKVSIFFRVEWVEGVRIEVNQSQISIDAFLKVIESQTKLTYKRYGDKYITLMPNNNEKARLNSDNEVTDQNFIADGNTYTINGEIKDGTTGESVIGASIYVEELKGGSSSNTYGFFSVSLPSGIYNLRISATGKLTHYQKVYLRKNETINIELFESQIQLNNVTISAEAMDHNISSAEMSTVKLSSQLLKTIPAFLGEADVIKSITLMPGVKTVGEGAGGFNVRGGNTDQNLILMDDIPLFNSSHLFGFYSTFNPDIVKDVTLYKGGIPAQYGGKLSSVLDVKLKDGSNEKLRVQGGIGVILSKLSLEGPIIKDKTSFIIGGRYAYPDWILEKVKNINVQNSSGYFYDLNLKLTHKINSKNSIHASAYMSEDGFKFAEDTTYSWKMISSSLKWNSIIKDKIFVNVAGLVSKYDYSVEGQKTQKEFVADLGVALYGLKADLSFSPNINNRIDFGGAINYYDLNPGSLTPISNSVITGSKLQHEYAIENALYIGNELKLSKALTVIAGLRFSNYSNTGPGDVYTYEANAPKSPSSITDTLTFSDNEKIKQYNNFEPRLSLKFSLSDRASIKVSYNRTVQYLHLISNTTAISPLDLWRSSNFHIKPQSSDQIAIGYFRNFLSGIEASVETYYKIVENMIEYKDGADLFMNPTIETELISANGIAYGVEFLLRKNVGKTTGWVGYTYSRTLRKTDGSYPSEVLNKGNYYPSNFDKPHDLTLVLNYKFTRRFSLSTNFTYSTGRPVTYPQSIYIIDGYAVSNYSERNQGRIPDYHRLDLAFTIDEGLKLNKKWKGSWTFSIYNVYGRKNPYSVFFKPEHGGKYTQAYQLSILGTVFPSVTYNFKF